MIDPRRPDFSKHPGGGSRARFHYEPRDAHAAPLVSIVTPFFNAGPEFEETARTVLGQSLQQWEWIIVDDGSTNAESRALLSRYRHRDPRIRVLELGTNRGLSGARNAGAIVARAPYLVLLDADDLLEPTAIEKWCWCLESYPALSFVKGYSVGFGAQEYLWSRGFHEATAFLGNNLVDTTAMIRAGIYRAVGGNDEAKREGLEDWDFWLRCAAAGFWGGTVPEYLNWYRRRADHGDRWSNLADEPRRARFAAELRRRHPHLWNGGFPQLELREESAYGALLADAPAPNHLVKAGRRLLLIVPWCAVGGVDRFNVDLIRQLGKRGWEVTVAATQVGAQPWLAELSAVTPDLFILHHFLRVADYPRFLSYLIESREVDAALVTNSILGYRLLPYLRARHPEVALAALSHIEERWQNGGYPRMAIAYQEMLDLNVAVSEHLARWMVAGGAEPDRVRVAYCGVDASLWRPDDVRGREVRQMLGLGTTTPPLVLYAGRICPQKQPRVLLRTMLELDRQGHGVVAVVAGDGPDLPWLRAAVTSHGLADRVRLLGEVPGARVRELMQAADIVFLPSEHEGIALVLYEAMACGTCVVAADVGGQRELVTTECGVLVQARNEDDQVHAYASEIATLLDDPGRRRQMGLTARARVMSAFSIETMGERMDALLDEARQLHETAPRPLPDLGLARACASAAVEAAREESGGGAPALLAAGRAPIAAACPSDHLLDPYRTAPGTLAYFTLRAALLPYYQWATKRRGLRRLPSLKERAKVWLVRRQRQEP